MATDQPDDKERRAAPTAVDLTPDRITAALSPVDAARDGEAPETVIFVGLLADDADAQFVRLYQDYELRSFVRIPRDQVVHRERSTNQANLEVSVLWVRKRARVEIREQSSEEFEADLLSRALQQAEAGGFARAADAAIPATPTLTPPISAAVCTRIFCTNATCACTARHSLACSLTCSRHPLCPNPWTENWFCASPR